MDDISDLAEDLNERIVRANLLVLAFNFGVSGKLLLQEGHLYFGRGPKANSITGEVWGLYWLSKEENKCALLNAPLRIRREALKRLSALVNQLKLTAHSMGTAFQEELVSTDAYLDQLEKEVEDAAG